MNDLWTIEERLQALEAQSHKAPSTNHGERLTALENAVAALQSDSHPDRGTTGGASTNVELEMYEWYNRVKRLI